MIGVSEQAAQTIVTTLSSLIIMIPMGQAEACSAISGNCIGANNVWLGQRFSKLIGKVTAFIVLIIATSVYFLRDKIAIMFTSD